MAAIDLAELTAFIVEAKAATYAGSGPASESSRLGSHDLAYAREPFAYLDSYFGGSDFAGQEVVHLNGRPVWVMNYFGRIVEPSLIDAAGAGRVVKESLSALYAEGRFLGGFEFRTGGWRYVDSNHGDTTHFHGHEVIVRDRVRVYRLVYHGGLVR
jgi:hypothetical protein